MSGYIGNILVPQATQTRDSFIATAGQTSFPTSGYTPNFLDVYLNGIKLHSSDFTATNGSDVVLTTGAAVNDVIEVVAFNAFDIASGTFDDLTVNNNIVVSGTVDGRDIAADGTKLDGIESGATGDQTNAEIRAAVEAATDSNVFTDADHTKLNAIEAGATADQTKADIDALNINADTLDGQHGSYYTGYADTAVANIVDSAPGTLDTLNELAAALGDDPNFATTTANNIATKLPLAGGTMTGALTTTGLTVDTDSIYAITGTNRVGINKTSPATTLDVGGSIYFSSILRSTTGGSASSPSIQPGLDGDTGMFWPSTNNIGFTTGGTERMRIDSSGIDVTGTVTSDGLTVDGDVAIASDLPSITLTDNNNSSSRADIEYNFGYLSIDADANAVDAAEAIDLKIGGATHFRLATGGDISFYEDTGTTAKFFWDSSAESLGIGTSSPSNQLHLQKSADNGVVIENTTGATLSLLATGAGRVRSSGVLIFDTGGATERMRIDSSGNLLVGTTDNNVTNNSGNNPGINIGVAGIKGFMSSARYQGPPLSINRLGNDGDIQLFSKDGVTVGSIGCYSDKFYIGDGDTGMCFVGEDDVVLPCSPSSNSNRDNAITLGAAAVRFKDAHFSGTVNATSFTGSGANLTGIEGVPQGVIVMWSGQTTAIPTGWALCDGTNGTPNLIDKFIMGASASNETTTGGANSRTLSTANMPNHTHSFSGTTNTTGAHTHDVYIRRDQYLTGDGITGNDTNGTDEGIYLPKISGVTSSNGDHSHTISGTTGSTGSGSSFDNRPAYMALAYIMKT